MAAYPGSGGVSYVQCQQNGVKFGPTILLGPYVKSGFTSSHHTRSSTKGKIATRLPSGILHGNYNNDLVPHEEFLGTRNRGNANIRLLSRIARGGVLGLV